jgi:hypothetical protein
VNEIRRRHSVVYDHYLEDYRMPVDLDETPLQDDTGKEVKLYDASGRKVARRSADVDMSKPPCGVLLNLKTIEQFYAVGHNNDSDDDLDNDDYESSPRVSVYPQAFLRNVGHIQSDGISPAFSKILGNINTAITAEYNRDDEEDEDDEDDEADEALIDSGIAIVSGISSQVYNEMIHRVRATAAQHDVQQGIITAAVTGSYATTTKNIAIAHGKQTICDTARPHTKFAQKISLPDCPRSLRYENVYQVDISLIPKRRRNGR